MLNEDISLSGIEKEASFSIEKKTRLFYRLIGVLAVLTLFLVYFFLFFYFRFTVAQVLLTICFLFTLYKCLMLLCFRLFFSVFYSSGYFFFFNHITKEKTQVDSQKVYLNKKEYIIWTKLQERTVAVKLSPKDLATIEKYL